MRTTGNFWILVQLGPIICNTQIIFTHTHIINCNLELLDCWATSTLEKNVCLNIKILATAFISPLGLLMNGCEVSEQSLFTVKLKATIHTMQRYCHL